MKEPVVMRCGCVSDAHRETPTGPVPCCIIHRTIEQAPTAPDVTGRKAKCAYGHNIVESSLRLPMFRHMPDREFDEYYCGCWGWD